MPLHGAALQSDGGLNPPQKVLRRRLGPAGRAAEERKLAEQELRELRDAKEAADAARAEAEAERLRLDARLQEQEEAMWAAKLAEQKATQRAQELEADLKGYAETASEVRSQVAELDEQLAAARAASEAATRRQAAALRAQLEKLEKELRDNALHTGRPSTQARWAIGVVQSLVPVESQQGQHLPRKKQASPALAHQPVTLANPVKSPPAARVSIDQRRPEREQSQHISAGGRATQIATLLSPAQQQVVRHKYSGPGGEEKAAAFLQSVVRGARARRQAKQRERCVRMLQAAMRGWNGRRAASRERLSAIARKQAEQELFERMQELAQRSGLRHDWRKQKDSARQPIETTQPGPRPEPGPEPEPELETKETQEQSWYSGLAAVENGMPVGGGPGMRENRQRRNHRPRTPEPALATTFAGLQPRARWRPAVATSQSVLAVRSSQRGHRRPATTDGAKWLGRDENFPDVRFPGGQLRRSTAESEVERATREWQRLQDTAATFGFAGANHARRKETQQRRNVQRWDGRALPCKEGHVSSVGIPGFGPVNLQATDTHQHSFAEDEFSDPSAVLDDTLVAESEAAMAALSQARANYEKASIGLPPRNPHTYVVEYPDGSLDMFGGGGVAVGPDEGENSSICLMSN